MSQRWAPVASDLVTAHVLACRADVELHARFFAKVDLGFGPDDCHVWTGGLSSEGYGVFSLPRARDTIRRVVRSHRIAWLWARGEIPAATPFLDHPPSCVGRFCINPAHLEPVDHEENMRRMTGTGRAAQRSLRHAELVARAARRAAGEDGVF